MKKFLFLLLTITLSACTQSPDVIWSFQTGGPVYTSPAIYRDRLIIGSNDHHLYALDLQNGKQFFRKDLGQRILATPLVDGDHVYLGTADGYFFSIDPGNGQVRWKFKTTGMIRNYTPCADETGIYFGSDANFYKLSRKGEPIWSFSTGGNMTATCVLYKNVVITSCWDTHFYGLDHSTGELLWKVSSGLINYGGPVLDGDFVFFGTHDKLYKIEAATGKVVKLMKTGYLDHPFIFEGSLWTNDGGVQKRDLDGNILAEINFPSMAMMSPVAGNGLIITGTVHRELIGVSTQLEVLWKHKGKDLFWCSGALLNGVYYTGNRDGYVYALRLPQ